MLLGKEEGGLYLQGVGYLLYVLKAHVYAELLDASDIGAMQPAPLCQLFLGEVCLTAVVPHIGRERLENAHKPPSSMVSTVKFSRSAIYESTEYM